MASVYRVVGTRGAVTLPPSKCNDQTVYSDWELTRRNLERFAKHHLAGIGPIDPFDYPIQFMTEVVLVHHESNPYNRFAMSVSAPPWFGGNLEERHLGYLSDGFLAGVGFELLPELAEFAGGEINATAELEIHEDFTAIGLRVPRYKKLRRAVEDFLAATVPADQRWSSRTDLGVDGGRRHTEDHPLTTEALARIREPLPEDPPPHTITIGRIGRLSAAERATFVADGSSGETVGIVANGRLEVRNEDHRPQLLQLLAEQGVAVTGNSLAGDQPEPPAWSAELPPSPWPGDRVPTMYTVDRIGGVDLRAGRGAKWGDEITVAVFNTGTRKLWVEDSRLVAPAFVYATRIGLDVRTFGLPKSPWNLDEEVPFEVLYDRAQAHPGQEPGVDAESIFAFNVLDDLRDLVPEEVFDGEVSWVGRYSGGHPEPDDVIIAQERHSTARAMLFGGPAVDDALAACRLCSEPTVSFRAVGVDGPLAYCRMCVGAALQGVVSDRSRAAKALRLLSDLEFGGAPVLEDQLRRLNLSAAAQVAAVEVDRLMLLRFGIARRRLPWTLLLEEAGLVPDGLRRGRGMLIRAVDGHLCLSLSERQVCDFFYEHGIAHDREPAYPIDPELNPRGRRRADWLLADGTFVEFWGLPNSPEYAARMEQKRQLAARHGLKLVELTARDLPALGSIFTPWSVRG